MLLVLACCFGVFGDPQGDPVVIVPPSLVVVAAHEKTGTVVSGQLVQALRPFVRATHNFYWDPRGNQARRAIEFVRNPFAMLMSAYLYHARCSEALFNHAPVGNSGYVPTIRLLVGTNVSFCQRLKTLPRFAGLRLQYDFSLRYPYPELLHSVKAAPPMLRLCLGDFVRHTRRELDRVGRVLGLDAWQVNQVEKTMRAMKKDSMRHNAVHFTHYDAATYDRDVRYLRRYDAFRGGAFKTLEENLGCRLQRPIAARA